MCECLHNNTQRGEGIFSGKVTLVCYPADCSGQLTTFLI